MTTTPSEASNTVVAASTQLNDWYQGRSKIRYAVTHPSRAA